MNGRRHYRGHHTWLTRRRGVYSKYWRRTCRRTYLKRDLRRLPLIQRADKFADLAEEPVIHPIKDESIRRKQPQRLAFLHRVQRTYPGIELLGGQLVFEVGHTLLPQKSIHARQPPSAHTKCKRPFEELRSLYFSIQVIHTRVRAS